LSGLRTKATIFIAIVVIVASVIIPIQVSADGGPMVDPLLFAQLQEGQQVAVIRLQDNNTASVDLFVSILDKTGESHDVTYFVPLGIGPSNFQVTQEDSVSFAIPNCGPGPIYFSELSAESAIFAGFICWCFADQWRLVNTALAAFAVEQLLFSGGTCSYVYNAKLTD